MPPKTPSDISLTARYTAAVWEDIGLPHAERFSDWRGKAMVKASLTAGRLVPGGIGQVLIDGSLVPRHLFMDEYVREHGIRQVVEIAAGYSPRGLMFANEGIRYIEVDRPRVMDEKRALSAGGGTLPEFLGLDATSPDFVDRVVERCDPTLATVILNEGMSPYFPRGAYVDVLRNMRRLAARLDAVFLADFYRAARRASWMRTWMDVGRIAIKVIADSVYIYAKDEADVRGVFAEAGWNVIAIHKPAADPAYTRGRAPAVKDWMYVVEARAAS